MIFAEPHEKRVLEFFTVITIGPFFLRRNWLIFNLNSVSGGEWNRPLPIFYSENSRGRPIVMRRWRNVVIHEIGHIHGLVILVTRSNDWE